MTVKIAVLKETRPGEKRVALVPVVADKLAKLGAELSFQTGAGLSSKLADTAYKSVKLIESSTPFQVWRGRSSTMATTEAPVGGSDPGPLRRQPARVRRTEERDRW